MVEELPSQVGFAPLVPRQTRLWDQTDFTTALLSVVQWDVQVSSWTGGASGLTWQIFSPAHAKHSESEFVSALQSKEKHGNGGKVPSFSHTEVHSIFSKIYFKLQMFTAHPKIEQKFVINIYNSEMVILI